MPNETKPPAQQSDTGSFFRELWERLFSPSPMFFKIIQRFLIFVGSLGVLAITLEATGRLPEHLKIFSNYAVLAATVAGWLVAKLPTVDKDRKVIDGELPYTAKKVSEGTEPLH